MPTLTCFVRGQETTFSVDIDKTRMVDYLKLEISKRHPETIANLDATSVTLYKVKVDLPDDNNEHKNTIENISKADYVFTLKHKLVSHRKISSYFTNDSENAIEVLVECPPAAVGGSVSTPKRKRRPSSPSPQGGATKRPRVSDGFAAPGPTDDHLVALSNLHTMAWGKQWPQSQGTISRAEITNGESVTDSEPGSADDDVDKALADTSVPEEFTYWFFTGMRDIKRALKATSDQDDVLIIRNEYKQLYNLLESQKANTRFRGYVVTGQPGIGKSTFLYYVLLRRLEAKPPTAVQLTKQHYYVFDESGAVIRPSRFFDPRLRECWALTDSNAVVTQPCAAFLSDALRIIQTTSPKPARWKEWYKQRGGIWVVVDPPSVPEIAAILKELGYKSSSTYSFVRKYGPSTQQAIRCGVRTDSSNATESSIATRDLDREIQSAVDSLFSTSSCVIGDLGQPRSNGSFVIFARRSPPVSEHGSEHGICFADVQSFIPTPHLRDLFETRFCRVGNDHYLQVFRALSLHPLTRTTAGWNHEKTTHERLCRGGVALPIIGNNGQTSTMQPSTSILPGTIGGLKQAGVGQSFYWMPAASNFVGVDSVLGTLDKRIYSIQATTAECHKDPIKGIEKVWAACTPKVRAECSWHYVVVTRTTEDAEKYVKEFSEKLHDFQLGQRPVAVWGCVIQSSRFM